MRIPVGMNRLRRAAVAAIGLATMAGCGGGDDEFVPFAVQDPGPVHVHGLGINPSDGALFIATHTGLWRLPPDAEKASRVADRYQDTMGFMVVGSDSFLGSGHPDVQEAREKGLPVLLGLIASEDAGVTWEPVSLLGEADFHLLRPAGERIYGFDATNVRLLLSEDGGETWGERSLPGFPAEPLLDLVIDPEDADHLIASTERQLHESSNGGGSWETLAPFPGLLAWLGPTLVLVDAAGGVHVSADGGRNWQRVGHTGGPPAALLAQDERTMYVALHDGTIMASGDSGYTWTLRARP